MINSVLSSVTSRCPRDPYQAVNNIKNNCFCIDKHIELVASVVLGSLGICGDYICMPQNSIVSESAANHTCVTTSSEEARCSASDLLCLPLTLLYAAGSLVSFVLYFKKSYKKSKPHYAEILSQLKEHSVPLMVSEEGVIFNSFQSTEVRLRRYIDPLVTSKKLILCFKDNLGFVASIIAFSSFGLSWQCFVTKMEAYSPICCVIGSYMKGVSGCLYLGNALVLFLSKKDAGEGAIIAQDEESSQDTAKSGSDRDSVVLVSRGSKVDWRNWGLFMLPIVDEEDSENDRE